MTESRITLYTTPEGDIKVDTILQDETIWLNQAQMAELFDVQRPAVTKHLKNIFESGELDEKVVSSILEHTTTNGSIEGKTQTKSIKYYNLDAISELAMSVRTLQNRKNTILSKISQPFLALPNRVFLENPLRNPCVKYHSFCASIDVIFPVIKEAFNAKTF